MLQHVTSAVLALGVYGVFIGMVLESCYIPVPSEILLPYAGYLAYLGRTTLAAAMLAGLLGGLVGATAGYLIARWGGRPLLDHYGRYLGIRTHEIERADKWFARHGDGAVFFGRLLPGVRTYISLPAGVAKMPLGRFLVFTLLGALPWTVLFTLLGYRLGPAWKHLGSWTHVFLAVVVVLFLAWVVTLWRPRAQKGPKR
ncbi:MAG: DedA family protein [Firmicutes bacterium]|nr:DedA family protein [Bacillota bacterium]